MRPRALAYEAAHQQLVQIDEHEAATGKTCPALVSIPGATTRVNAFKLVAITGDRFLNAFHLSPASSGCQPPKRTRRGSAKAPIERGRADAVSSAAEAAAADALVAIVEGDAPERLTAQAVVDLADAVQLYNAGAVLAALPAYIKPLFSAGEGVALDEV